MKKYPLLILFALLLAACSKSSDGGNSNNTNSVSKSANLKETGASANDILSNANFSSLEIEIGYVGNYQPTQEAVDNLLAFLEARTYKQDITVNYKTLPSPKKDTLSLEEIADLEKVNRTAYNNGNTLAIYIYFADAPSEDDNASTGEVTLGAVYRNTSMVIYEATVRELAARTPLISLADAETATINHEFGHLFGLVDLGSPEVNPHEDTASKNHCDRSGCLMRAELEFGAGLMSTLQSRVGRAAVVPGLDSECILDLQANGGR